MRQSIESLSQQTQMLTKLVESSLSVDLPKANRTSGDKRGISAMNPTPTKEPQSARQKTPTTDSQVQSVPMHQSDVYVADEAIARLHKIREERRALAE